MEEGEGAAKQQAATWSPFTRLAAHLSSAAYTCKPTRSHVHAFVGDQL